jgi:hypothetical protein
MKVLKITHEDGSVWRVPAEVVAQERAEYYARNDVRSEGGEAYDTTVEKEIAYALRVDRELRDWAANNMLWEELRPMAVQVEPSDTPPREMATADLQLEELKDGGDGSGGVLSREG